MLGLGQLSILAHVGIGHGNAVMACVMEVEGRGVAVDLVGLGAQLHHVIVFHEPIGCLDRLGLPIRITTLDDMAEHLDTHGNRDGAIVHVTDCEAHFAGSGDGGEFFGVAHGCYSIQLSSLSSLFDEVEVAAMVALAIEGV